MHSYHICTITKEKRVNIGAPLYFLKKKLMHFIKSAEGHSLSTQEVDKKPNPSPPFLMTKRRIKI
jgi:hypothetical protein